MYITLISLNIFFFFVGGFKLGLLYKPFWHLTQKILSGQYRTFKIRTNICQRMEIKLRYDNYGCMYEYTIRHGHVSERNRIQRLSGRIYDFFNLFIEPYHFFLNFIIFQQLLWFKVRKYELVRFKTGYVRFVSLSSTFVKDSE